MKIQLHHINLSTSRMDAMDAFYRDVLDLENEPSMERFRRRDQGYDGAVSFFSDGTTQLHVAEKDLDVAFRTGHAINPLERGHIAFRTDDIDSFKRRLDEKGIHYANYGSRAMEGWEQIFFHDPDGNIIEVHQVRE